MRILHNLPLTSDAAILVQRGATGAASGVNLLAAYAVAKLLKPGGNALSATNRATVLIPPGTYTLTTSAAHGLTLDTDFVDLMAMVPRDPEGTWITNSTDAAYATIKQTADDVRLSGFTIHAAGTTGGCHGFLIDATDNAASKYGDVDFRHANSAANHNGVYGDSDINGTWIHCRADAYSWRLAANMALGATMNDCEAGVYSLGGDLTGVSISGTFRRCIVGSQCFGGCGSFGCNITADAVFEDCVAGNQSYAMGKVCAGSFYRCRGGTQCFGGFAAVAPTFAGYAEDCVAGFNSFGAGGGAALNTGNIIRCRVVDMVSPMHLEGASLRDCELNIVSTDSNNRDCVVLEDSTSKLLGCTLLVAPAGSGVPIQSDGTARSVVAAHCRMNNADIEATGLGTTGGEEVTNLIGTPANVIDDDMSL